MNESLPPDVLVTELPGGGIGYRLPDRPPTLAARASGCGPLVHGLVFTAVGGMILYLVLTVLGNVIRSAARGGRPEWSQAVLVLHLLLGGGLLIWGLTRLRTGLLRLGGCHRRIEVRGGRLRVVDWLGPVRRVESRRLDRLRRLEIGPDPTAPPGGPAAPAAPLALTADCADTLLVLASGYPHTWLARLAPHLQQRCALAGAESGALIRGEPVPVVTVPALAGSSHLGQPPATARAAVAEQGGVVTLTVRPPNLRYARKEPLFFGIPFLAITLLVGWGVLGDLRTLSWGVVPVLGMLGAFGAVGLVFTVKALRFVSTRAQLAVSRTDVDLTQADWLGGRRRHWDRADLEGVGLSDSNLPRSKGRSPPRELQLRFADGTRTGLFGGRDERELGWLASVLDDALQRLPAVKPHGPAAVPDQPPGSRAVLERTHDGFRLTEPPLGWTGRLPWVALAGLLVLAAGVTGGVALARNWALLDVGAQVAGTLGSAVAALLGGAFVVETVNFARRRRLVIVAGKTLRLRPTTWWGDRERVWRRREITAIDVGYEPFPQLRIHTQKGSPQPFMAYHRRDEILWVAALLRQALDVPACKE